MPVMPKTRSQTETSNKILELINMAGVSVFPVIFYDIWLSLSTLCPAPFSSAIEIASPSFYAT